MLRILALFLLVFVFQPAFAGDVFAGKEVYKQHCQDCHGATGRGELAMMPNFSRGEGIMKTDREMYRLILQGKGIMPGYEGVLPDEDVDNVIAYLKTFL